MDTGDGLAGATLIRKQHIPDMQAERDHLRTHVFPALEERL
jgi:hypothetical protein